MRTELQVKNHSKSGQLLFETKSYNKEQYRNRIFKRIKEIKKIKKVESSHIWV